MHIYKPQEYPNLLPVISLTSEEIRNLVSTYKLSFYKVWDTEVEWRIKLPMFVDAFYAYIIENQTIPNQKQACDFYFEYNKLFFDNLYRPDLELGIMARAYRTYPSLVRDIHFNKFIDEKLGGKCQVIYNTRLDVEEGIDLMIITKKNNYGVCFFTNTRRAYIGRKAKEHRHVFFENVKYVEIPIRFKCSVEAGDFFLYGEKEYNVLYNTLSK